MGLFDKKIDPEEPGTEETESNIETENKERPYDVNIICANCDDNDTYKVPFGKTKEDFFKVMKCVISKTSKNNHILSKT